MTVKQMAQLSEIRRLLKEAYDDYFARDDDGCHKSSEMACEVYYPNYWEVDPDAPLKANGIGVYTYVFGPSRMHYFDTFEEAVEAVREWHRDQLARDYSEEAWT